MAASAKTRVIPLQTHEQFEAMYNPTAEQTPLTQPVLVYFTADWCGACKRVDWEFLLEEFPDLPVYRCDVDANKYTPGFCGVRSIPSFVMIKGTKQVEGPIQTSETAKIATWIHQGLTKAAKGK